MYSWIAEVPQGHVLCGMELFLKATMQQDEDHHVKLSII